MKNKVLLTAALAAVCITAAEVAAEEVVRIDCSNVSDASFVTKDERALLYGLDLTNKMNDGEFNTFKMTSKELPLATHMAYWFCLRYKHKVSSTSITWNGREYEIHWKWEASSTQTAAWQLGPTNVCRARFFIALNF